jgi:hypothetical protein
MKKLYNKVKAYVQTVYRLFRYKKNIFLHVKKDDTFGLVYFNMTEEEARRFLFGSFEHFAYKHVVKSEIDDMTK